MAATNDSEQKERIAKLYKALKKKDNEHVAEVCHEFPEGPLQRISIYNDTVLHMATHSKQKDLVLKLLNMLPADRQLSDIKNNDGNTILHEVATSDAMKDVAEELLTRDSDLLIASNDSGETPIFCAARYGQTEMFKFLAGKMGLTKEGPEDYKLYLRRKDGTTVLHISIATECFDEETFKRDVMKNKRLTLTALVKNLAKHDTSWDANINSKAVGQDESKEHEIEEHFSKLSQKKEGQNSQESLTNKDKKCDETPLFLATMSNIEEIVDKILYFHPQAFTHTNKEGMNILHVAILYRHIDIFDMVVKSEVLARRLLSATDNKGNSVLHMVSQKRKSQASEKMQSPALQLQDELLLFEKVKSACKMHLTKPLNKDHQTAEELFAASNENLHKDAKEWLMATTENCTILSVFIATVAFAAAYTVPGGPNQETGIPILHSKPFFMVFILADVLSLTLALTSVGLFFSILTSSFPLEDFKTYLFRKLTQGVICLVLSVSMMAVAFGATIVLIMTHSPKNVVWDVVAFLPVPIFFLSYSPLRSAVLGPCSKWFKSFVASFLIVVAILFVIFLFVLLCLSFLPLALAFFSFSMVIVTFIVLLLLPIFLLYGAFVGLRWTVRKAPEFLCKPAYWISGNKSQPESDTQSPQPTTSAPLTDQV
ncbi:ankyrin repeat-containing protein At5g02620-like isoform X2 [Vitis riparia]|uniref:ankyrin repeat-containing protein At5g02620-like isoform X2 n=1 Tax=Vitis riparia TaxID=96939 RepID=UPI00155AC8AE|nr:ankyrin repeat-containing protein At5g02620-like isoform X2 [Vitis riparia]